jgi:hypothetical protein
MKAMNRYPAPLTLIPTSSGRRRLAMVAVAAIAGMLQFEAGGLMISLTTRSAMAQQAAGGRSLAVLVVPKTTKDEIPALVVRGLLRQTADRMVRAGMDRAATSPVAETVPIDALAAKVAEGGRMMTDGRWVDSLKLFREVETDITKTLGVAPRSLVARTFKGLGLSLQQNRRQMQAKEMIRRTFFLWPGQKQSEYAYNLETGNLFSQIQREVLDSPMGDLTVSTSVPGAEVYVDYEFRGFSPMKVDGLTTGDHLVTVTRDGYLVESRFVPVRGGPAEEASFQLVAAPIQRAMNDGIAQTLKAASRGTADVEAERLASVVKATDLLVVQVSRQKDGFVLEGLYWMAGKGARNIKETWGQEELVAGVQGMLASLSGIEPATVTALGPLDSPTVALPTQGSGIADIGQTPNDQDLMIDPNSPIFGDTSKKPREFNVVGKWWFWTALVVGMGAIAGVTYWGVTSGQADSGGGPTGRINVGFHGVD